MLAPEEYDRWLLPQDRRILESLPAAAWFNVLHLCRGRLHFEVARELPVQVVSWSIHDPGNPTLAAGRELSGKAVMGGFAQRTTLARGSAEEVAREAAEAIADTGGRRLLLAPGCSVPPAAPARNIAAMAEAAAA
jgi:uroporphyrinogen decarboxylase